MRHLARLQDEIETRYDRLHATDAQAIDHQVGLTCGWVLKQPELRAILTEAEQAEPGLDFEAWRTSLRSEQFTWAPSRTEAGQAWLVWQLMNHIAAGEAPGATYQVRDYSKPLTDGLRREVGVKADNNVKVRAFVEQVFQPFFHYLSDQVSLGSAVAHVLQRYVARVEWFDRQQLHDRFKQVTDASGVGEDVYDGDLQRFLFLDAGYITQAKARSASGEADLIGGLDTDDPLICEGKLYRENSGVAHLAKGFAQIIRYAHDYNRTVAHLVIFNLTEPLLEVPTDGPAGAWMRYIEHAGVRVNLLVVRAYPPTATASKAGRARTVEIKRKDLVGSPATRSGS